MRTETVRCPCVTDEVCAVLALRIGRGTPRKFGCWVWTVVPPRAEHFRTHWSGDIRRERWTPSVAARSAAMPTVDDPWKSRFGPKTGRIDPSQHGRNPRSRHMGVSTRRTSHTSSQAPEALSVHRPGDTTRVPGTDTGGPPPDVSSRPSPTRRHRTFRLDPCPRLGTPPEAHRDAMSPRRRQPAVGAPTWNRVPKGSVMSASRP